VIIEN
jgi:hypothetical protein